MALDRVSFRKPRERGERISAPYDPTKRHSRYWTEEEKAVVRRLYPEFGAARVKIELPHRHISGIYQQARQMGLVAPKTPETRQRHPADPETDRQIAEAWPTLKGRGAVNALADRLGKPRWWVSKRALALGLKDRPHVKEPPWQPAELELLRRISLASPDKAARVFREHGFRRSATSIVVKSKREGLSRRDKAPLSATGIAKILGLDNKTVVTWLLAGEIPDAGRRGTKRLPQQGGDTWAIERPVARRWILDNQERIDIRKVDKYAFIQLLTEGSDGISGQVDRDEETGELLFGLWLGTELLFTVSLDRFQDWVKAETGEEIDLAGGA